MKQISFDIVIVGGGTAGAFAAAKAAAAGLDVVILERKSRDQAGEIACGDAIKGKHSLPDVMDLDYLRAESFTNRAITGARFENPIDGQTLEIPFDESSVVIDRKRYGEVVLEEAERLGADIHFDTVVNDLVQNDDRVEGVVAVRDGVQTRYEAAVTVDAAGALSVLQDKGDFSASTFDTNVNYSQFCSAYREILDVPDPVPWKDSLVFKPTERLGYLWYFPRDGTEINAGLGFQMNKDPMELVDILKDDLQNRPEFADATVRNKLGAALPTRRPYDSAVADGFVAAGDSAAHVNPTTGGGIVAAAKSAVAATERAIEGITSDDVSEERLWGYNDEVMTDFGARFAAADLYNIWGGANSVDELSGIVSAIPGEALVAGLSSGDASVGLASKLKILLRTVGHWDTLRELSQVRSKAQTLKEHYLSYPSHPEGLPAWQSERDEILADVYEITGAEPKY